MKSDTLYSLSIIALSLVFLIWIIPAECPTSDIEGDIPSSLVPNLSMLVILSCGVFLLRKSLRGRKTGLVHENGAEGEPGMAESADTIGEEGLFTKERSIIKWFLSSYLGRLITILTVIISYVVFFWWVGFYSTTVVYLTVSLYKMNRIGFLRCAVMSALMLIITYVLFEVGLKVNMPRGFLF